MTPIPLLLSTFLASLAALQVPPPATPATGRDMTPVAPPEMPQSRGGMPPADAPIDLPPGFEAIKRPSESWSTQDRGPEAVVRGTSALAGLAKAYAAPKALEERVSLVISFPGGAQERNEIQMAFGPEGSARLVADGATVTRIGDDIYFERSSQSPRYIKVTKAGSLLDAMSEMFGNPSIILPQISLRSGDSSRAAEALGGAFMPDAKVAGFRAVEGKPSEILLQGPESGGEAEVVIDAASGRLAGIRYSVVPQGMPQEFRIPVNMEVVSTAHAEGLPTPIAFDTKGRRAVDSMEDLDQPLLKGDPAPEFRLKDPYGREVSLESLRGNVVVLDFWATWCRPCLIGLPRLDRFAKWAAESGKPVKVFAVNTKERDEAERARRIGEFWKSKNFSFPTLLDDGEVTALAYGAEGIPFTVVIGPDGRVVASHLGQMPDLDTLLKLETEAALSAAPRTE